MEIKNVLVTGEPCFLDRHQFLFKSLANHFEQIRFLPRQNEWYEAKIPRTVIKGLLKLRTGDLSRVNAVFQKNKMAFVMKSQRAERDIQQLDNPPDLVFQVFGTYSPFWNHSEIPYVMYLDYTTALAEKNWPSWATFLNYRSRDAWFECEQLAYARAKHIFCMSQVVKDSLVQDYAIPPQTITVVGSSGDFQEPYAGEKTFGRHQLLFNGSDFDRKGGDLVLAAFREVRQAIPDAKLAIVGKTLTSDEVGVCNPGYITSRSQMHQLFLETDLVIAPASCDPFPTFLMEAMNYGVPCVVSKRDGMPEIVDHGVNGMVIDSLSAERFAETIVNLLQDSSKLSSLSQAARHKIKMQLNWSSVVNVILSTLTV